MNARGKMLTPEFIVLTNLDEFLCAINTILLARVGGSAIFEFKVSYLDLKHPRMNTTGTLKNQHKDKQRQSHQTKPKLVLAAIRGNEQ